MKAPLAGTSVKMVISLLRPLLFAPVGRFSITVTKRAMSIPPRPRPNWRPSCSQLALSPHGGRCRGARLWLNKSKRERKKQNKTKQINQYRIKNPATTKTNNNNKTKRKTNRKTKSITATFASIIPYKLNHIRSATFCFHVDLSKNHFPRYNWIKPIFAADQLSSFTRLDFLTRFSEEFRITSKGYPQKQKQKKQTNDAVYYKPRRWS